jgi:hypothetical protein
MSPFLRKCRTGAIWGTRMLNGEFSYDFAVYPFVNDWPEASIDRSTL